MWFVPSTAPVGSRVERLGGVFDSSVYHAVKATLDGAYEDTVLETQDLEVLRVRESERLAVASRTMEQRWAAEAAHHVRRPDRRWYVTDDPYVTEARTARGEVLGHVSHPGKIITDCADLERAWASDRLDERRKQFAHWASKRSEAERVSLELAVYGNSWVLAGKG